MTVAATVQQVRVDGHAIGYREQGSGPAVLLIHDWPTSSFLWRNVMPAMTERNRVVAIDVPGFGLSDKPLDVRYGFDFHEDAIERLLEVLGIGQVALAGHDLGGPIGVHWALRNPDPAPGSRSRTRLRYPEFSETVREFVTACATPELRAWLTSPAGLEQVMRRGLADQSILTDEVLSAVLEPFDREARRALAEAASVSSSRAFGRSLGRCLRWTCPCGSSMGPRTGSCPTLPRPWLGSPGRAPDRRDCPAGLRTLPPGGGGG